mgnify:CR=1 FL=1
MLKVKLIVKSIILNRRLGKILLLKRESDDNIDPGKWENCGGNMEFGETPKEAIRREIIEETGISDIKIYEPVYTTYVNKQEPYLILVYLSETDTETVTLSAEHQDYIWASKEECQKLLEGGIKKDFIKNKVYERSWSNEE